MEEQKDMFRSEDMTFVRILMHSENTRATLRALGSFGLLHVVNVRTSHDL
mgnify:CR=1 FL=1